MNAGNSARTTHATVLMIKFSSIISNLTFYNTIQNIAPIQVQSLLIFPLQVTANSNPNGLMLLNIYGFGNPRFLDNSS
jgi:hypothetical protein